MHSIVKDQDSSPNLTARAVICMDMVLPTQEAATELVQSIANSAENPLSIGSVSTIDISRFGNTLGSAAMECSRIVRTVTPYEEDGGVMRCRSCPLSATLIDAGLMNRIVTPICGRYWFDQITIGSVVRTTTIGNNNDVRLGTVSNINEDGDATVTYVEGNGDRVAYYHNASDLHPADDAERLSVLGERENFVGFEEISPYQMSLCTLCADADGETQTAVGCKTCHRAPVLPGLTLCGGPDCGNHHCIGYIDVDGTKQFTCGDTSGVKLTNDNMKKSGVARIARCDGCYKTLKMVLHAAQSGRHIEPAHIRAAEEASREASEDSLVFGPPLAAAYFPRGKQCRVVDCESIQQGSANYNCCKAHGKVYKRRFVDGTEADPHV